MCHDPVVQGFPEKTTTGNTDLCWKEERQKLNEHIEELTKKKRQRLDETNAIILAST